MLNWVRLGIPVTENAAGANYDSVDLRDKSEHNTKDAEKKHCVVQKWIKDLNKVGMTGKSKLNYTILRTSLMASLNEAECSQ